MPEPAALPFDHREAIAHLSKADRRLARLIEKTLAKSIEFNLNIEERETPYESLLQAIDGAPHVPTGDGAIGAPALAECGQLARLGNFFLAVGNGESLLHAVVVDGQDVGAAEAEDEEHLDGPRADAAHRDEPVEHAGKSARKITKSAPAKKEKRRS